jgi:hypothetical protein
MRVAEKLDWKGLITLDLLIVKNMFKNSRGLTRNVKPWKFIAFPSNFRISQLQFFSKLIVLRLELLTFVLGIGLFGKQTKLSYILTYINFGFPQSVEKSVWCQDRIHSAFNAIYHHVFWSQTWYRKTWITLRNSTFISERTVLQFP